MSNSQETPQSTHYGKKVAHRWAPFCNERLSGCETDQTHHFVEVCVLHASDLLVLLALTSVLTVFSTYHPDSLPYSRNISERTPFTNKPPFHQRATPASSSPVEWWRRHIEAARRDPTDLWATRWRFASHFWNRTKTFGPQMARKRNKTLRPYRMAVLDYPQFYPHKFETTFEIWRLKNWSPYKMKCPDIHKSASHWKSFNAPSQPTCQNSTKWLA